MGIAQPTHLGLNRLNGFILWPYRFLLPQVMIPEEPRACVGGVSPGALVHDMRIEYKVIPSLNLNPYPDV